MDKLNLLKEMLAKKELNRPNHPKFMENNFTIVFSGYNILDFLKASIGSFLELYPYLKENIVVFDDDSTDGTFEWLKENNIKRITWTEKYKQQRDKHYSNKEKRSLIYRVGLIMNNIIEQVNTKYLILSDGDVVFTMPFLEELEFYLSLGNKVLYCKGRHGAELFEDDRFRNYVNYFPEYKKLFSNNRKYLWRAHQYFTVMDLEFLKENNISHDRVFDSVLEMVQSENPPLVDAGLDFLAVLIDKNIKILELPFYQESLDIPIFHFGFISSVRRIEDDFNSKLKPENEETVKLLGEKAPHILKIANKFGLRL